MLFGSIIFDNEEFQVGILWRVVHTWLSIYKFMLPSKDLILSKDSCHLFDAFVTILLKESEVSFFGPSTNSVRDFVINFSRLEFDVARGKSPSLWFSDFPKCVTNAYEATKIERDDKLVGILVNRIHKF